MTEIGPLLLPPPTALSGRGVTYVRNGKGEARADGALTQVEAAGDATGGPRAKNFRFRVVDGGRSDQLGNAEVPARSQRDAAETDTASARAGTAAIGRDQPSGKSGNGAVPAGTPVATFLAQLIAQEQLAPGLYDPPVKAADRAYRQAGAEPPLNDAETATARFKIAV
jgi:hypothetical protein